MGHIYEFQGAQDLFSPSLVYYKEIIVENIKKAIDIAGGPGRLWPHVKSHKCSGMVKLQQSMGISRFKCATIAEAEMLGRCGAENILLAYPLVGPDIGRFIKLKQTYPESEYWAIGDDMGQIRTLSLALEDLGITTRFLVDMNLGMNRTGVPMENAGKFYEECAALGGLDVKGFHCYDGNHNHPDIVQRNKDVDVTAEIIRGIKKSLEEKGLECGVFVMGGTPSFPCHARYEGVYLSPGTAFLTDAGYYRKFPDMDFVPAAAVITRVISHPAPSMFTLDLGYKGIASDPDGVRGYMVDKEGCEPGPQSEEHWVFTVEQGVEVPPVGEMAYVIPTHICPTSALYSRIPVVEGGKVTEWWNVDARNREITI